VAEGFGPDDATTTGSALFAGRQVPIPARFAGDMKLGNQSFASFPPPGTRHFFWRAGARRSPEIGMSEHYTLRCRECNRDWGNRPSSICEDCLAPLDVKYDLDAARSSFTPGPLIDHLIWGQRKIGAIAPTDLGDPVERSMPKHRE